MKRFFKSLFLFTVLIGPLAFAKGKGGGGSGGNGGGGGGGPIGTGNIAR